MNRQLVELAAAYGIQTSYKDMWRKRREACTESIYTVLRALGAPVESMNDVKEALRARKTERQNERPEPVILAWDGKLAGSLRASRRARSTLVLEDGTSAKWPPGRLPAGYHQLTVETGSDRSESLVISAPTRAYFPLSQPAWGVFAPVYALHSKRSSGAGDLTDLESITTWMQQLGGQVTATLPLLANFMEEPCEPSPYSPASRIFWNEFYIDPARTPEFETGTAARRLMNSRPRRSKFVDYRGTMEMKRRVLEALADSFFAEAGEQRREEFERFLQSHPEVHDYARFRAVTDRQRKGWRAWPERLRNGEIREADFDNGVYLYHMYAQWQAQQQMEQIAGRTKNRGGSLYLDLPLGLHADSYDTWRYRNFFVSDMSGGAPPDPVFTSGQNWGFPPMHPQAMRANRHQYTIAYIRNHLRYAGLLRIDHVMGLHRLYWIPDGVSGDKGVYVQYRSEELYAILSLESHRNGAGIVGENLGTVPPEVHASMARHNIQKMYVLQYEIVNDPKRSTLHKPGADTVASLNTHDMPPFRAFLDGADIPDRVDLKFLDASGARSEKKHRDRLRKVLTQFLKKQGLLARSSQTAPEDVFRSCLRFLGESAAGLVLVNLEDLWQETNPQNVPATSSERPNWRRRLRYSVEQLTKAEGVEELLRELDGFRKKIGENGPRKRQKGAEKSRKQR